MESQNLREQRPVETHRPRTVVGTSGVGSYRVVARWNLRIHSGLHPRYPSTGIRAGLMAADRVIRLIAVILHFAGAGKGRSALRACAKRISSVADVELLLSTWPTLCGKATHQGQQRDADPESRTTKTPTDDLRLDFHLGLNSPWNSVAHLEPSDLAIFCLHGLEFRYP